MEYLYNTMFLSNKNKQTTGTYSNINKSKYYIQGNKSDIEMQVQYSSDYFRILQLQIGDSGFRGLGLTEKGHVKIFSGSEYGLYLD